MSGDYVDGASHKFCNIALLRCVNCNILMVIDTKILINILGRCIYGLFMYSDASFIAVYISTLLILFLISLTNYLPVVVNIVRF